MGINFAAVVSNYLRSKNYFKNTTDNEKSDEKNVALRKQQQVENKKAKFTAIGMLVLILALSCSSLLKNCVVLNFSKLKESRSRCDDCSVANAAISLWMGVHQSNGNNNLQEQTTKNIKINHKLLLTSGDLYFGPLIFLEPFLRISSSSFPSSTLVTWIDIEV